MKSAFRKHAMIFFKELSNRGRYRTYSMLDMLTQAPERFDNRYVHVGLRFDVDDGCDLCIPAAQELRQREMAASFYFLTHPDRYYDIWSSNVPKLMADAGFEVGLHSDHYYESLTRGTDPLARIREDVTALSRAIGKNIAGMLAHGHPAVMSVADQIWDVYKDIDPAEFGLVYHDVTLQHMEEERHMVSVQDYLGVPNGWRYWPAYPRHALRRLKPGDQVIFKLHPHNFFKGKFPGQPQGIKNLPRNVYYFFRIRLRRQLVGTILGEGKSVRKEIKRFFKRSRD